MISPRIRNNVVIYWSVQDQQQIAYNPSMFQLTEENGSGDVNCNFITYLYYINLASGSSPIF
jgi:hypothetical protein